ncbi:MAG: TipAS antibiotic-recognition domain-containing protein [Minisyncoccia bacterium]
MSFTQKTGDFLEYLDEARKKYGPVVDETADKVQSWGAEKARLVNEEGEKILDELAQLVETSVDTPRVQELIQEYHAHLNNYYETGKEQFAKISELYTDDERFSAYFKKFHHKLPKFMRDAIHAYSKSSHSKKE